MKIATYCPACSNQLTADADQARLGLVCPDCQVGFIPDKVDVLVDENTMPLGERPPLLPAVRKRNEHDRVAHHAANVATISYICFLLAALGIVYWFLSAREYVSSNSMTQKGFTPGPVVFAGACAAWGIALQVLAQLMHIRALLSGK